MVINTGINMGIRISTIKGNHQICTQILPITTKILMRPILLNTKITQWAHPHPQPDKASLSQSLARCSIIVLFSIILSPNHSNSIETNPSLSIVWIHGKHTTTECRLCHFLMVHLFVLLHRSVLLLGTILCG